MNKKLLSLLVILALATSSIFAQGETKAFEPGGKVTGNIYFNYHYDLTNKVVKRSQFEMKRAYFGYMYNFSENLTGKVTYDMSYSDSTGSYSGFLKFASMEWKPIPTFTIEGGMIPTHMWDTQEKIWGYRYIMETAQDLAKFYSSADLGLKATIKPIDQLEFHLGLYNGEGFKKTQDNYGVHRVSVDAVVRPVDGLILKVYYDQMAKEDSTIKNNDLKKTISTTNFFVGYEKQGLFRAGLEYDIQKNMSHKKDHEMKGLSVYGAYTGVEKFEFFARWDQLASNTLDNAKDPWNYGKDNSLMIVGAQYTHVKGVKFALNYQQLTPRKSGIDPTQMIYLNMELKF